MTCNLKNGMVKVLSTVLIVGLFLTQVTAQFQSKTAKTMDGHWEYEKIWIDGEVIDGSEQNECGYRDILEISKSDQVEEYKFDSLKIVGHPLGTSNTKVCTIDPISFEHVITNNACETIWLKRVDRPNRIVGISEGVVVEYAIKRLTIKFMIILKTREIINYGVQLPSKIKLKKIG